MGFIRVLTIFVHRDGHTRQVQSLDRTWLSRSFDGYVWVDLAAPSIPEQLILSDTFLFHPLSVEDARSARQFPKIEAYDSYLYVILHGIDFLDGKHVFGTHDVDFFIGRNYLVTVHDGRSRTLDDLREHCERNAAMLGEGPVALFHRVVDGLVDHYRPEVEKLEDRLDELEHAVFEEPSPELLREILRYKKDVSQLRRIAIPQRDVIARLARRDFVDISTEMSFRFRDIYDHLVRITDEAAMFQDRLTGMLDVHLSNTSNRLNEVMKVLTVVATIFMPLTLVTGIWGMNMHLPVLPGDETAQFWDLMVAMGGVVVAMLGVFRYKRWI